ncbi:glycosyltransferase family 1 protein [Phycomyces blakesleeanus NRRL 1555(-)]|uniref:Glycosyltransferase family 1 protein n=1 Tax=Phycomyces blakesleeanus (strain ATCC 8743b / DSM 1359 / FGSC 10004 / NBRC 33097 / NRRL 1555) TaxID=763407 RepID=A0A162T169_PHYB8|nr:glycosyltransferase family 1 protein [Phycomyces blakesleeanus NRRL 1555(-)]OAD65422.1 glycosyltransferase family 1 protein [Phycomyces blakesleeanus NRRL 1555(-)]|eukprot:XP_018283462.1 glycosyltransferase family 1 protein [Phycomyces blakesleeanus NRRL 1555(-)]
MKWPIIFNFLLFILLSFIVPTRSIDNPNPNTLELVEDFRVSKNIVFSCQAGGSSHINWVLLILEELATRGHNITYITRDDHLKFGKPYPKIKSVSIGKRLVQSWLPTTSGKRGDWIERMKVVEGPIRSETEKEVAFYRSYFTENNVDVALCDMFTTICVLVAREMKIPFIITSSIDISPDSKAPYINNGIMDMEDPITLYQSYFKRLYTTTILPYTTIYRTMGYAKEFSRKLDSVGISGFNGNEIGLWKDSLKMVNTVFGFEPARPVGPLVEFVGPIIPRNHQPLTDSLKSYLDTHQRIAYIAFGQHATPELHDTRLILTAMFENIENGALDGFVWATVHLTKDFPTSITTSSNTTYYYSDLIKDKIPSSRLVRWAPQYAVLNHPSTIMFMTHGGAGSLHEALFAGKRLVGYPFCGDQPGTARNIERSKLGAFVDYKKSQLEANKAIERVVRDKGGVIQQTVNRYKALVQIHTQTGVRRGADLVEEVAFVNVDGALPHRYEVARKMSFVKANNLDVHATWILAVLGLFYLIVLGVKSAILSIYTSVHRSRKLKTL